MLKSLKIAKLPLNIAETESVRDAAAYSVVFAVLLLLVAALVHDDDYGRRRIDDDAGTAAYSDCVPS